MLTNSVTGTTTFGFDAPGAEISTSPEQFPATRPEVFTCTLIVAGVAPVCCEITSQLLPQFAVFAVAVKLTLAPVLLWMEIGWGVGLVVPICQANAT